MIHSLQRVFQNLSNNVTILHKTLIFINFFKEYNKFLLLSAHLLHYASSNLFDYQKIQNLFLKTYWFWEHECSRCSLWWHLAPHYHHRHSHTTISVRLSTEICCIILKNDRKLMFYAILLHQLKAFESFFTMNE